MTEHLPARFHVVYAGAPRFSFDVAQKLGRIAESTLSTYVSENELGLAASRNRLVAKLRKEPVEDFRIDFEDGYGPHSDIEEDREAARVRNELERGFTEGVLPRSIGVRLTALDGASAHGGLARSARTLGILAPAFARAPESTRLVVTIPKVEDVRTLSQAARMLGDAERAAGLEARRIELEAMVESPRALLSKDGRNPLREWLAGSDGRLHAVHFGAYDYLSSMGVPAPFQRLHHPLCLDALIRMKLAFEGTRVRVFDGATHVLPLASKTASEEEAKATVLRGLELHASHVRGALELGIFGGWDLHPAQLVARFATLIAFFRSALPDFEKRREAFLRAQKSPSRVDAQFDDAATIAGFRAFEAQGLAVGAFEPEDLG